MSTSKDFFCLFGLSESQSCAVATDGPVFVDVADDIHEHTVCICTCVCEFVYMCVYTYVCVVCVCLCCFKFESLFRSFDVV